ncbi:DUF262 domain-containing protein [Brasilonema sp. CT11]|nr:DUF262 domain-containing protein [Brasilonema sp. CT11]
MSIRPDNLSLDKLLQGRLFRIPDYQRAYSWETKQRKDLFGDIQKLAKNHNNERRHFMSTVVCLQTKQKEEVGADEFGIFYIVDGQQRLTTLIILLKALEKELLIGSEIDRKESTKLDELLVKENGRLILLQTNHDSKRLFRHYLEKGEIPSEEEVETLADRNMIKAFQECEQFVKQWSPDYLSLLKLVKNRLDFIFYVLEDEGSVHTTFEVLNSRGLEVDWLDKCKSILMGIAFEKLADASQEYIHELHNYWSEIYRTIGLKKIQGQEILRFAATLEDTNERSKISSAEDAMDFFRQRCEKDPKSVIDVSANFLKITEKLDYFVTNPRLTAVTKIAHARLLGVAIMLNKELDAVHKQRIITEWEKVTFRIFGLSRRDARTKIGEYVRLARLIFKAENMPSTKVVEKVASLGEDYPASEAAKALKDTNCYEGWEDELIYFFYRYEEYLTLTYGGSVSDEVWVQVWNSSPTKTIEHIHPQSFNENWRGKLGTKRDYVERQAQRLGNLILLPPGVNSSANDQSFKKKKEIYEKHRHLKLIDEILAKDDWNVETVNEREERLIIWAEKQWE